MYMPPSYSENPYKVYKVLLMHDGQNLFDPATSAFGTAWYTPSCIFTTTMLTCMSAGYMHRLVQDTMNRLIMNGDAEDVVVIGMAKHHDTIITIIMTTTI